MRLVPILLLAALASPAAAETKKEKAASEFAEGQKQFNAKDYVKAAERFKAAWAADEDPVYLFNIAQALRLAKQCNESRDYYKKLLAVAGPSVPNKDKIDKWLAEVEACSTPEKPVAPDPKPVDPPKEPVKTQPRPTPAPMTKEELGRGRRATGLIMIGVGAVATGVGVVFTRKVSDAERRREALCGSPCMWDASLALLEREANDDGKRYSRIAITSFAVGGAAIVGGIVLYVIGRSAGKERVAVTPTPGGAVAQVGFEF